jgi:hypothetical protein
MMNFGVEFVFQEKEEVTQTQITAVPFSVKTLWCSIEVSHAQFLGQNVVDGLVIQIQLTTDHSDCQTSIRPHDSPHFGHIFFHF